MLRFYIDTYTDDSRIGDLDTPDESTKVTVEYIYKNKRNINITQGNNRTNDEEIEQFIGDVMFEIVRVPSGTPIPPKNALIEYLGEDFIVVGTERFIMRLGNRECHTIMVKRNDEIN
ncbi:MAG: hypothetical protein HAW67_00190 [Endozoicomonadaceae bacterium]|nr:hypothetical protein [Endozoicomonadaceae bacterium]